VYGLSQVPWDKNGPAGPQLFYAREREIYYESIAILLTMIWCTRAHAHAVADAANDVNVGRIVRSASSYLSSSCSSSTKPPSIYNR
jgi:hypothetical protein